MSVYVLDANIVSYYLRGNEVLIERIKSELKLGNMILIAPIAYYEVKRGLLAVNALKSLKEFEDFGRLFSIGKLDNSIEYYAVEKMRVYGK